MQATASKTRELPILFYADMVRAIIEGRKTQTRRQINWKRLHQQAGLPYPTKCKLAHFRIINNWALDAGDDMMREVNCPYGQPGDLLYVRETWRSMGFDGDNNSMLFQYLDETSRWIEMPVGSRLFAQAKWKPSIHMPKEAARIWLKVTDVRVEKLQDISEEDAKAEGVQLVDEKIGWWLNYYQVKNEPFDSVLDNAAASYKSLWQKINGAESWDLNPWVWVLRFEVLSTTGKQNDERSVASKAK